MYPLLRTLSVRQLLVEQFLALAIVWVIAELFYKFKSFSLESAALLLSPFVRDAPVQDPRELFALPPESAAADR